jgi:hypothetical protein
MVDSLDLHHMVGQTPLVEKTVAAQRENAQQMHNQNAQIQRLREHPPEKVERERETSALERKAEDEHRKPESNRPQAESGEPDAETPEPVKLVQEEAETPVHKLDVTI